MLHAACPIDEIFWAAAQFEPGAERQAYLASACGDDVNLRRNVDRLLSAQPKLSVFLERPFVDAATAGGESGAYETPGSVIGPYKLLEQIGEGGMGLVFMAEQTEPVRRKVAVKIIKPGMDTRQVIARFEAERQALALMDHPNIARILDAGAIEATGHRLQATGIPSDLKPEACSLKPAARPYFVMELVRGVPITDFCDQHRLDTRRRLALFAQVCRAVQHAHQKGIIHRDLKPSNVLVTLHDTVPVPKVIDFGIAKALDQPLTERTLFTQFAQLVGTPLYMSPEQAQMSGLDVDTRSDVYALGVLLYELLTGTTPFESEHLKRVGFDEMRRLIREEEPPRPSQRVSTLQAAALTTLSERRGVDGRRLGSLLRGELDWVVMRALEKDRNRRYESAGALAAEVDRYLADEPVEAGPPSAWYRLRKYVRRNRRLLVTAGLVAMAMVAGTAASVWQAIEATRARRDAVREAAIATAVGDFLQDDLLGQVDNTSFAVERMEENRKLTVREALDRAANRIGNRFQEQPLVEAAIRKTIGDAYNSVSEGQLAVPHLELAADLRKRHLGPDHPVTLLAMQSLAEALASVGRVSDQIALFEQILEKRTASLGPNHPLTLLAMHCLGEACRKLGILERAVRLMESALERQKVILGPNHPVTINSVHTLGIIYADLGRYREAVALIQQAWEERMADTSRDISLDVFTLRTLAETLQKAGEFGQADRWLREAIKVSWKDHVKAPTRPAYMRALLGLNLLRQQKPAEAEAILRESLAMYQKSDTDDWRRYYALSLLGESLLDQEQYHAAEPLLLEGYEGMRQREALILAEWKYRLPEAVERVVRLYERTNRLEKARSWREKLLPDKRSSN